MSEIDRQRIEGVKALRAFGFRWHEGQWVRPTALNDKWLPEADLPTKSIIIDAEAAACNANGMPDFVALHGRGAKPEDICCWAFDLLRHNSLDTRPLPLMARRAKLETILEKFDNGFVRFSETFSDAKRLLAECEKHGLEGIVSKRKDAPYRSGKCDWVKVKTEAWREANKARGDLFIPRSPPRGLPAHRNRARS